MLAERLGEQEFEVRFVDVNSPEIFEFPEEFADIAGDFNILPYISLNGTLFLGGERNPAVIIRELEIRGFLKERV
ncbi:hypothetical protein [Limisalsivibrio acetivorans]|uniref:hypothetical protein n=1 Tax=Limisalsivibrio acetivorans TaxID=1304888 RepID=UPI00138B0991|nr:hypothetical protein [Limisalsivibrio acetivorans]